MRQTHALNEDGLHMQLAMKFGDDEFNSIYAISNPLYFDYEDIYKAHSSIDGFLQIVSCMGFDIMHVGRGDRIKFITVPSPRLGSFASQFQPIDPMPQEHKEEGLNEFKFFKVAKPNIKDLIVDPKDVQELLDIVIKAQKPSIDAIKQRERSRANEFSMRAGLQISPGREVQAQLISLAI